MIKICKQYNVENENKVRCYCNIDIDGKEKEIWFEVEKKYEKYLVLDRADAYLIGILNFAMRNNHNIKCEMPVTDELLHNIKEVIIPILSKYSNDLYNIEIDAATIKPLTPGKHIGTGLSCGIDSFYSLHKHFDDAYPSMKLTDVCINNVGAFNECYSDYGMDKTKEERYKTTEKVANEAKINLIKTDSNFYDVINQKHSLSHTYSSVFAIYMLQGYWNKYYYASSGYDFSFFELKDNGKNDCAEYELLSLQYFSTSAIRIYSDGGEKERIEKTKYITDFDLAQKYLHVCVKKSTNCGKCPKCRRTLTALDALGKLQNFSKVFDIKYYESNKKEYYKWLFIQHLKKDAMNEPTYQMLKKQKKFNKYNMQFILVEMPKYVIKRIIPKKIKTAIKKIKK